MAAARTLGAAEGKRDSVDMSSKLGFTDAAPALNAAPLLCLPPIPLPSIIASEARAANASGGWRNIPETVRDSIAQLTDAVFGLHAATSSLSAGVNRRAGHAEVIEALAGRASQEQLVSLSRYIQRDLLPRLEQPCPAHAASSRTVAQLMTRVGQLEAVVTAQDSALQYLQRQLHDEKAGRQARRKAAIGGAAGLGLGAAGGHAGHAPAPHCSNAGYASDGVDNDDDDGEFITRAELNAHLAAFQASMREGLAAAVVQAVATSGEVATPASVQASVTAASAATLAAAKDQAAAVAERTVSTALSTKLPELLAGQVQPSVTTSLAQALGQATAHKADSSVVRALSNDVEVLADAVDELRRRQRSRDAVSSLSHELSPSRLGHGGSSDSPTRVARAGSPAASPGRRGQVSPPRPVRPSAGAVLGTDAPSTSTAATSRQLHTLHLEVLSLRSELAGLKASAAVAGSGAVSPSTAPPEATAAAVQQAVQSSVATLLERSVDVAVAAAVDTAVHESLPSEIHRALREPSGPSRRVLEDVVHSSVQRAVSSETQVAIAHSVQPAVETAVTAAVAHAMEHAPVVERHIDKALERSLKSKLALVSTSLHTGLERQVSSLRESFARELESKTQAVRDEVSRELKGRPARPEVLRLIEQQAAGGSSSGTGSAGAGTAAGSGGRGYIARTGGREPSLDRSSLQSTVQPLVAAAVRDSVKGLEERLRGEALRSLTAEAVAEARVAVSHDLEPVTTRIAALAAQCQAVSSQLQGIQTEVRAVKEGLVHGGSPAAFDGSASASTAIGQPGALSQTGADHPAPQQLGHLRATVSALSATLISLQEQLSSLQEGQASLQQEQAAMQGALQSVQKAQHGFEGKTSHLASAQQSLSSDLRQMGHRTDDLGRRLSGLEQDSQGLEGRTAAIEVQHRAVLDVLRSLGFSVPMPGPGPTAGSGGGGAASTAVVPVAQPSLALPPLIAPGSGPLLAGRWVWKNRQLTSAASIAAAAAVADGSKEGLVGSPRGRGQGSDPSSTALALAFASSCVLWDVQAVNTAPAQLLWNTGAPGAGVQVTAATAATAAATQNRSVITAAKSGLYRLCLGFFSLVPPSLTILVNGLPVLTTGQPVETVVSGPALPGPVLAGGSAALGRSGVGSARGKTMPSSGSGGRHGGSGLDSSTDSAGLDLTAEYAVPSAARGAAAGHDAVDNEDGEAESGPSLLPGVQLGGSGPVLHRHPDGSVAGVSVVHFLALPSHARLSVRYEGPTKGQGFLELSKL